MKGRRPDTAPVTLVLAVHNAESYLPDLLTSIGRLRLLPSELSITDLGSTDGTVLLLRAWQPSAPVPVRLSIAPGASTAQGRNLAIESASFDHIAVIDGAVLLHPDWLTGIWTALAASGEVVVGQVQPVGVCMIERVIGRVQTPEPGEFAPASSRPSRRLRPRRAAPSGAAEVSDRICQTFSSRSVALSKASWDAVGGYPEWLRHGQDKAFARALREGGATFRFAPAARSTWNSGQTLAGYVAECFRVSEAEGRARIVGKPGRAVIAAILGGAAAIVLRRSVLGKLLATGAVGAHLGPYLRRVWRTRTGSPDGVAIRMLATVVAVAAGDVGRISGYPAGLLKSCWDNQTSEDALHGIDAVGVFTAAVPVMGRTAPGRHRRVGS